MKRMILRVVVLVLTFVVGIAADWFFLRRTVNNTPAACFETASPAPVAPPLAPVVPAAVVAPAPAATPVPHFILDYDPDTFFPYGVYYLMDPKPKDFEGLEGFEFGAPGHSLKDGAYISVYRRYSDDSLGGPNAVFGLVTKRRFVFATSKSTDTGVEYHFEGEFLRTDFDAVTDKNIAVLRGVLTRTLDGRTLVKHTVSFKFVYMGC